jgi:hypothetical protein
MAFFAYKSLTSYEMVLVTFGATLITIQLTIHETHQR